MNQRDPPRHGATGYTFVELMVVILIIGLAATAVMLAIPDSEGSLQAEAERFAARAKAARDDAIVEARPATLTVDARGYRIMRRESGAWREAGEFDWASSTDVQTSSGGTRFDSTGLAEPLNVTLQRDARSIAVEIRNDGTVHVRR